MADNRQGVSPDARRRHGLNKSGPVFVSTLTVDADAFVRRHPDVTADLDQGRILRSVLMKPESQTYVPELHARLEALASR